MRRPHYIFMLLIGLLLPAAGASAQQLALALDSDCLSIEPDPVQISWVEPCENGNWLYDTELGCRMWDWHPDVHDRAVWNGACPHGIKQGRGIVQWFEHGQAIDRFEGTYRDGKRQGFGRYAWNATDRFEGTYVNDIPQGFGTATLAGETFTGDWQNGCFAKGAHVVAIGVPRRSCAPLVSSAN